MPGGRNHVYRDFLTPGISRIWSNNSLLFLGKQPRKDIKDGSVSSRMGKNGKHVAVCEQENRTQQ